MSYGNSDDCSNDDRNDDLRIIWRCNTCGYEREDYPGYNEGGQCSCGGWYEEAGVSYAGERRS